MTASNQHGASVVPPHAETEDIESLLTALCKKTHLRETENKRNEESWVLTMQIFSVFLLCSQPPNHAHGEYTQNFSSLQERMEKIDQ